MDAVEMLLKFVPRARSVSSVATKLGGARVAEPHRAMTNPLGMDALQDQSAARDDAGFII